MNLYHLTQNLLSGYEYFTSFAVIADSEEEARSFHPSGKPLTAVMPDEHGCVEWPTDQQYIVCELIATDLKNCVKMIVESSYYNA